MYKYILLFISFFASSGADAQCLTNSLVINTGYDPLTGLAVAPGALGGTPAPDPKWIVSYVSPGIIAAAGGLTVVPAGGPADVIPTLSGWISTPIGIPGAWISCLNSHTYSTDGTGPTGTPYNTILTRPFRMCSADSIELDFYIADDNYVSAIDVDGVLTTFSQPAVASVTTFTTFAHFTQTFYLSAGAHSVNVVLNNYNETSVTPNPMGLNIYGTISSATTTNSLVSESFASCASYVCTNTCSNSISLSDTLNACVGDLDTLSATITGGDSILDIIWRPAAGLSDTTILNPVLTVGATSSYYHLTVRSLIPFNLVTNGDFSAGNTGFTSSYLYTAGPSGVLLEGRYSVYTNPFGVHGGFTSFGDHTTGTGRMMIINGSPTPTDVWCQTIPVNPNTDYDFSAWIANCSSVTVGADVPILQFRINGVLIGTPTAITSLPGVWTNFFSTWNSGVSTTANICIYDMNTTAAGNDFAIDDISFREICVARDSVYVNVAIPDTIITSWDTTLCVSGAPITLFSTVGYTSYLWSTGATSTSILAPVSGTYWVRNINNCDIKIDTFNVTYAPFPIVNLGTDTAFCVGNTLTLSSAQPAGSSYLWSDGSSGVSYTATTTGLYWLQVDNGYCTSTDSVNVTISPHPVVDLGPDAFNCTGAPVTLSSSVIYSSPSYLWSEGSTTPSITVPLSGTYWLQVTVAGCAGVDTIGVTIIYDTFTLGNIDTAICRGDFVQTRLTVNPSATVQWLPTAGISTPTMVTPKITPDTSDMYNVVISIAGCPDLIDSFYIDVQPRPEVDISGFREVCEFDTLHLRALVNPQWYGGYLYHWNPAPFVDDTSAYSVVFKGIDSVKLILTVTTPAGCKGMDSALMVVYPGNFASLDTNYHLCPHDTIQLKPTGGVSYSWHPVLYLDDPLSATPWVRAITSQAYTAIATSQFGCLDTISTNVVMHSGGQIFLGDSATIFPGESYQIRSQTNCATFTWFPPAGLNNPYISDPVATPGISTKYFVHAKTEWGCEAIDSINIYYDISAVLALPNAFAPGSLMNGKLHLIRRGEATLNHFRIFNRWGNLIFETSDINEGWDGSYKGKAQPFGVYVYEIEAVTNIGQIFHKHGNVTLIR